MAKSIKMIFLVYIPATIMEWGRVVMYGVGDGNENNACGNG